MRLWTWGEMRNKIEADLDLTGESFITDSEMIGYANDAIDDAEKEIITVSENYFETVSSIDLVSGTSTYDLPTNIYANKVSIMFLVRNNQRYKIKPLKKLSDLKYFDSNDTTNVHFFYRLSNTEDGPQVKLYPTPSENITEGIELWYIRNANQVVDDDTIVDMPEAANFIMQFVKDKCKNKEVGVPDDGDSSALAQQRQRLVEVLENKTLDEDDNVLDPDLNFICELDYGLEY